MAQLRYLSFTKGELAPALHGRVDQVAYSTGLRTLRNFFIGRAGGVQNRPGTRFVGEIPDGSTATAKLIPWIFSSDQTYVLVLTALKMFFIRNGGFILESTQAITDITQANPGVVTITGHGYSNGDYVYIASVSGMTEVNGRTFEIGGVTANTFTLLNVNDGSNIDTSGFTAYTSGGTAARYYSITTPYAEADLPTLQYTQNADVMVICHQTYAPRKLSRTGHTSWTLSTIDYVPTISGPTAASGSAGASGSDTYEYIVTAVREETYEESLPGTEATVSITGATQANPVVITATAHGYANGDQVLIDGVGGMVEINDRIFTVAGQTANTFQLSGIDGSSFTAYTSGGTTGRVNIKITSAAAPTSTEPHVISWTASSNAVEYNVYKKKNGVFGFIGIAGSTSFDDEGFEPDITDSPPQQRFLFRTSSNYPGAVAYAQQRLWFGSTANDPEKVWSSRVLSYDNFTISFPILEDDSVTFTLTGPQVNGLRHILDLERLILMTAAEELICNGNGDGIVTPTDINIKPISRNGSSTLKPIVIDQSALYVQARGRAIRDLGYNVAADGYTGNDLTVFSTHLFENNTISDWAFQLIPYSIVWLVRDDGDVLGLTYVKEHEIWGWHRHDFAPSGEAENVAVIPSTNEGETYFVIKRTINGKTTRYVERLATRFVDSDNLDNSIFVDSCVTYDGSSTSTITGLWHLEGQNVSVWSGTTQANPNNSAYTVRTVANGQVTLGSAVTKAQLGIPITADLETLDVNIGANGAPTIGQRKLFNVVNFLLEKSTKFWVGPADPGSDTITVATTTLHEVPLTDPETGVASTNFTGPAKVSIRGEWTKTGRIFLKMSDPGPLHILTIAPTGDP